MKPRRGRSSDELYLGLGAVIVVVLPAGIIWLVCRWRAIAHGELNCIDFAAAGAVLFIWGGLSSGMRKKKRWKRRQPWD